MEEEVFSLAFLQQRCQPTCLITTSTELAGTILRNRAHSSRISFVGNWPGDFLLPSLGEWELQTIYIVDEAGNIEWVTFDSREHTVVFSETN